MCGRYTITVTLEELMAHYLIEESRFPRYEPRYNVAPGQLIPAIIHDGERNRLGGLKWGLIPSWAQDEKIGSRMLNARSETAAVKPAFRQALRQRRCLIPADGFYEWQQVAGGKQPMRIIKADGGLFSMAGLYESWVAEDGRRVSSCTILTTAPNELMAPIHDRMPVILQQEDEPLWLDRQVQSPEALQYLFKPYPAEQLKAYPVSTAVGSVRQDDPTCIEPL
ncbi:SOS response-associated peptidase [Paenibacillus sambharensis]|uniref:Abasic site processing protein n=1 Tax=Paenibacillus sambharensis TaxID=1803190 RepID=A0A2W1LFP9_9BACL|nr:SOS response-associated peptidase [Paenibacillus sambharensis]PZD93264.1 SOS response-associated peptidase [Paenibacillus sambharensis]